MERLSCLLAPPGPVVGCGVILSWLALDEKGQMITDKITGTSTINIPAFAFGRAVLPHTAVDATKELNIRVGDQIAVIDMREDEFDQLWLVKSNLQTGLVPASCIRLIEKICPPPVKNIEAPKSSAKRKSRHYNRPTIEHSVTLRDQSGTADDESEATAVKATETETRRKPGPFNGSRNSLSSISQSNNCTAIGAAIVLTEFVARQPGEISLKVGTVVSLLEADSTETMWKGKNSTCEVQHAYMYETHTHL
ncbi:hypothetical protein SARC_05519 [Sphaeroforma arctica JP610]|uniref:SH3 domain-containing protein n=1 Tax=Sphaeroforma arctica JP610 TaxID=667725 RepID=A0A0L0FZD5_9EUKA|nr:hypothetical protein SARC_05519 [Sphaeroforma arctica JP610]KNC82180.1 hypothetical protein SARC_05519 [Sphaeroforma arctica JP610]|eukprot:XP_014156082.1 hypothetical protein SARC_05519 [Sphaeroforma arctica JP610]